jgi:hypothetical protein
MHFEQNKQTDFSVVIKSRGKPRTPWRWEIYRAGHSKAVAHSPEFGNYMVDVPDTRCSVMPDRLANESAEFEVTDEMLNAGGRVLEEGYYGNGCYDVRKEVLCRIFQAMFAARPEREGLTHQIEPGSHQSHPPA